MDVPKRRFKWNQIRNSQVWLCLLSFGTLVAQRTTCAETLFLGLGGLGAQVAHNTTCTETHFLGFGGLAHRWCTRPLAQKHSSQASEAWRTGGAPVAHRTFYLERVFSGFRGLACRWHTRPLTPNVIFKLWKAWRISGEREMCPWAISKYFGD
jgi:hypothetical protein